MALNWVRSLIVQCFCRRPDSFLKDKHSYYSESRDDLYDSEDNYDDNGFVNNMGPADTIPQIVLIECNPAFEDDSPRGTPRIIRKYLTVPERR